MMCKVNVLASVVKV